MKDKFFIMLCKLRWHSEGNFFLRGYKVQTTFSYSVSLLSFEIVIKKLRDFLLINRISSKSLKKKWYCLLESRANSRIITRPLTVVSVWRFTTTIVPFHKLKRLHNTIRMGRWNVSIFLAFPFLWWKTFHSSCFQSCDTKKSSGELSFSPFSFLSSGGEKLWDISQSSILCLLFPIRSAEKTLRGKLISPLAKTFLQSCEEF